VHRSPADDVVSTAKADVQVMCMHPLDERTDRDAHGTSGAIDEGDRVIKSYGRVNGSES
jgi:hypothetical protein